MSARTTFLLAALLGGMATVPDAPPRRREPEPPRPEPDPRPASERPYMRERRKEERLAFSDWRGLADRRAFLAGVVDVPEPAPPFPGVDAEDQRRTRKRRRNQKKRRGW